MYARAIVNIATIASHVDCLCTNKILILRFKVDFAEVLCNFQGREAYLMGINTNYGKIRSTESWSVLMLRTLNMEVVILTGQP